jgi:hypothetical protein
MEIYENACVYVIEGGPHIYVGATKRPDNLKQRLGEHRYSHACEKTLKKRTPTTSSKCFEYDDVTIRPIENLSNCSKENLHKREKYYIRRLNCVNKYGNPNNK